LTSLANVKFYGNGQALHDKIAGKKGSFARSVEKVNNGASPKIIVTRKNAFFLDKIVSFIATLTNKEVSITPFNPSPVKDMANRYDDFLKELEIKSREIGIGIEINDEKLLPALRKGQELSAKIPETELLRLMGIICRTVLVGPHWFVFETINACNSNCLYCNIHSPSRTPSKDFLQDQLPFEVFCHVIDDLAKMGVDGISVLANGEPLLHPNFADMVQLGKEKGFMVNFFTNGLLLDERISRAIVKVGADEAFVTISAATEETYLALHSKQRAGDYQQVLDNLARLRDLKKENSAFFPRVTGVHVICSENYTEIMEMAKQGARLGFSKLRLALIRLDNHNRDLALKDENIEELKKGLDELELFCNENNIELWEGYRFQLEHATAPFDWSGNEFVEKGCLIGWGLGLIKANADLSFCCVVKPIANLKDGKRLHDIWNSEFYHEIRGAALDLSKENDIEFTDGSKLYTAACRHCDNHDINAMLHKRLRETGLIEFLD